MTVPVNEAPINQENGAVLVHRSVFATVLGITSTVVCTVLGTGMLTQPSILMDSGSVLGESHMICSCVYIYTRSLSRRIRVLTQHSLSAQNTKLTLFCAPHTQEQLLLQGLQRLPLTRFGRLRKCRSVSRKYTARHLSVPTRTLEGCSLDVSARPLPSLFKVRFRTISFVFSINHSPKYVRRLIRTFCAPSPHILSRNELFRCDHLHCDRRWRATANILTRRDLGTRSR